MNHCDQFSVLVSSTLSLRSNSWTDDIGHQAVTSDLLLKAGWRNDGFGRYFMGSIAINMQGDEDHFTVFTSVGLSKVVLGRVSTMSEVEALTAIAKRGIEKE